MKRWEPTETQWRGIEWLLVLLMVLIAGLCSACSARSQEIAVVGAATADLVLTETALANGGTEANPLMENRAARIAGKAAATTLVVLLARQLEDEHPKLASVMRLSTVGVWAGASVWNMTVSW
jgi:hypothetical protein